ncbi:MAG: 50S ribosomal protein L1 [Candidatus Magasanikbacteria bacterium]
MSSKRMTELNAKVDKTKAYSIEEAVALLKEVATAKFDESVEIHANLGIDPKKSDQQIRETVVLPHGTGKTKKIAAFVGSNDEKAAREAGADVIFGEEEVKELAKTGKIDFEVAVATPEMMPKIAVVARVLGPRGLMPNPKTGTVGPDVAKMIRELKSGKIAYKNDDTGNIHQIVGKISFDADKLKENVETMIESLKKVKPTSQKGIYFKGLYITTTMGPSVKIQIV